MSTAHAFIYQMPLLRREEKVPVAKQILLREDLAQIRSSLGEALANKVSSGAELLQSLQRQQRDETLPTSLPPVDRLLGGGLLRGKLTEIHGHRSTGRFTVVLSTLAAATSVGEAAALIDVGDNFDPAAAEAAGADLRRILWIRPRNIKDAVHSAEMVIHSGFQLVVIDLGIHPRGRRAPDAAWVRLARSAEVAGTAILVSSPWPVSGTAAVAVVATEKGRPQWTGRPHAPRLLQGIGSGLRLEKHRHLKPGKEEGVMGVLNIEN